jgi:NAD-dependent DNA ligase
VFFKDDQNHCAALIMQRRRQFLLHSFLFHVLSESIAPDKDFDRWARELIKLQTQYPALCASLPFHSLTKDLGGDLSSEAMGLSKNDFPLVIVSAALHILRRHKNSKQSFKEFAKKYGYR